MDPSPHIINLNRNLLSLDYRELTSSKKCASGGDEPTHLIHCKDSTFACKVWWVLDKLGNLAKDFGNCNWGLDWVIDFVHTVLTNEIWKAFSEVVFMRESFGLWWSFIEACRISFWSKPKPLHHVEYVWVIGDTIWDSSVCLQASPLKSFCSFCGTLWQGTSEEAGVKMISGTLMSQWPSKSNIEVHKAWIWFSFVVCREGWDLASETPQKKTG